MRSMNKLLVAAVTAGALILGSDRAADAGSLDISPVTFQLYGPERAATLTVRNTEAEVTEVQVRAFDWTQSGDDILTPSDILQISPPFFELGPDEEQVVRLIVTDEVDTSREVAFRLFIDEVPTGGSEQVGVVVPLRIVLPVFLTPSMDARPNLSWTATEHGDRLEVSVTNSGDSRERIVNLGIIDQTGGNSTLVENLAGYVLAGSTRSWTFTTTALHGADELLISGDGYGGSFHAIVTAQE